MPFFGFRRTSSLKYKKKKNSEPTTPPVRKDLLGIDEDIARDIKRFSDGLLDQSLVIGENQDRLVNNTEVLVKKGTPEAKRKHGTLPAIQQHVKTEDLDSPTVGKSELADFKVPTLEPPSEENKIVVTKTTMENTENEDVIGTPSPPKPSNDEEQNNTESTVSVGPATEVDEVIPIIPSNGESTSSEESEKEQIVVVRRRERTSRNNRRRAKNVNDIKLHRRSQHFEDNPIDVLRVKAKYRQSRNFEEDIENSKQARFLFYILSLFFSPVFEESF